MYVHRRIFTEEPIPTLETRGGDGHLSNAATVPPALVATDVASGVVGGDGSGGSNGR